NVEVRYRSTPVRARIESLESGVRAIFHEPQVVSPGQSLVMYSPSGEQCYGGGVMRF
ncbi:tRNA 2-thiouridine(34) synthase MnmA, partial [Candidatus Parcubacteria bacterium]